MARSFNGSSDFVSTAINLSAFNKISIGFWLNWTTFANDDKLALEFSTNYGANSGGFIIDPDSNGPSAGTFYIGFNGNGGLSVAHFTRPSAGVWHPYLFQIDGTQSNNANLTFPFIYVDGASQTVIADINSATAHNMGNYTLYSMSRAGTTLFGAGSMADLAIWGVLLTAGEALALARGIRPGAIRPSSLTVWQPMDGLTSPEPDLSGNAKNGTLTGTAYAPGPPTTLFTPRWPMFTPSVAGIPLIGSTRLLRI